MIEIIAALLGALLGLSAAALLRARQRKRSVAPTTTTAVEHRTERELDQADIIDEVAAETDVSAADLAELLDLADQTRRRY